MWGVKPAVAVEVRGIPPWGVRGFPHKSPGFPSMSTEMRCQYWSCQLDCPPRSRLGDHVHTIPKESYP